jgi:drug/metabolite transporter (DMT)-like permease
MSRTTAPRREKLVRGVSTIVATMIVASLGDALVKYVSADFSLWQIYVVRSLLVIPMIVALLLADPRPLIVSRRSLGWALLRSLLLMVMWLAFYAALSTLSLPVVAAAYYTAPLFITLFSAASGGEAVGARRWIAILAGFVGVLIILRPGTEAFSWLILLPVLSAVFYALAAVVTRARCADERPLALSLALNLSFLVTGAIASAVIAAWAPDAALAGANPFLLGHWTPMGVRAWGIMAMLAVLIVAISAGIAGAYQCAAPTIIATFEYSYLVFAATWSFVLFADLPDPPTIAGMLLIAGAGLVVVAQQKSPQAASLAAQQARVETQRRAGL